MKETLYALMRLKFKVFKVLKAVCRAFKVGTSYIVNINLI